MRPCFTQRVCKFTVVLSFTCVLARAEIFQIKDRASDLNSSVPAEAALLSALHALADSVEDTVNNGFLDAASRQAFADSLAKSGVSPTSSLMADRSSDVDDRVLGVAAQVNLYSPTGTYSTTINNSLPAFSGSGQASVLIGIPASNLGLSKSKRLAFYLSGFAYSLNMSGIGVNLMNVGFAARYQLVPALGSKFVLKWSGINLLAGLSYSTNRLDYSATLSQSSTTSVGGSPAVVSANLQYTVGVQSHNLVIPIELSTGFRLFYLFSIYGGGAVDINVGSSGLVGTASGPITATYSGPISVPNLFSGTAELNLDDGTASTPSVFAARGFIGAGLELGLFGVSAEYAMYASGAMGVSTMVRTSF